MKKSQNQKQNCCQLLQGQLKRATKHDQIKAKKPKKKKTKNKIATQSY